jgi:hypothetical protein
VQDIRKVLANLDVEGLTRIGAPRDEYDSEARELAFRIQQEGVPSEDGLFEWLRQIWTTNFDLGPEDIAKRENSLRTAAKHIRCFSER